MDAALATASTAGPMDDAVGNGVHAPTGVVDDAARPGVDAISGPFLASEYTGGSTDAQYGEHGQCSKSCKASQEEAQRRRCSGEELIWTKTESNHSAARRGN
jgi:hypothetical protein